MGIVLRLLASAVVLCIISFTSQAFNSAGTIGAGAAAVLQFDNSDASYMASQAGMRFFTGLTDMGFFWWLLSAFLLITIWWTPIKRTLTMTTALGLVAGLLLLPNHQAHAYYDKSDYTEVKEILPNESAFLIPEVGANQDSQKQFGSIEYLEKNKVALKRITIPHVKLEGSGLWSNFYVPGARVVVLDRTPVYREWSDSTHKGTTQKAEGFECESKDSLDVKVAIGMGAYVTEQDAAKFLYRFGVKKVAGDPNDPQVIFTSVLYATNLSEVMDTVIRGKVGATLCSQIGSRMLDDVFAQKAEIIKAVSDEVTKSLAISGVTVDFLGYASALEYSEEIQKAINKVYKANKEAAAAKAIADAVPVMQAEADMDVKRGLARGLGDKGLPNLPSFMMVPSSIVDAFTNWFGKEAPAKKPGS